MILYLLNYKPSTMWLRVSLVSIILTVTRTHPFIQNGVGNELEDDSASGQFENTPINGEAAPDNRQGTGESASLLEDGTPSPPVILEDGEMEEYVLEYEQYDTMLENKLKDIHRRLYESKGEDDFVERSKSDTPEAIADAPPKEDLVSEKQDPDDAQYLPPTVEITAVVSFSSSEQVEEDEMAPKSADPGRRHSSREIFDPAKAENTEDEDILMEDVSLVLTWWQLLLLILASLLLAILCSYFSGCCFVVVDCCADPFWGCCPCCSCCVRTLKPRAKSKMKKTTVHVSTTYSLNESSTAPRRSVERSNISLQEPLLSSRRITTVPQPSDSSPTVTGSQPTVVSAGSDLLPRQGRAPSTDSRQPRAASVHRASSSRSVSSSAVPAPAVVRTESRAGSMRTVNGGGTLGNGTSNSSTAIQETSTLGSNSVRSVRNYRRPSGSGGYGSRKYSGPGHDTNSYLASLTRAESADHHATPACGPGSQQNNGYFSWLNVLGGKRRRYKVSTTRKKQDKTTDGIYRQSKYRHIADSRHSAVIPVKISKRASTASNYSVRPLRVRSKSAETVDSVQGSPSSQHLMAARSERHIPASRLSANLAEIEARRISGRAGGTAVTCPVPPTEEYNLKYFEKSLLQSKETTL